MKPSTERLTTALASLLFGVASLWLAYTVSHRLALALFLLLWSINLSESLREMRRGLR